MEGRACLRVLPFDDGMVGEGGGAGWGGGSGREGGGWLEGAPPASESPPGGGDSQRTPEPDHRAPSSRRRGAARRLSPPPPLPPLLLLDAAATGGRATELRGARGRPRGPAESCRRVVLLPAPLAGHQTRLAGAEGARRCLCAYTLMQAALPPGRQWRWSAPFPPPCARGRVPGMGGHHQRPGLRQGAVISDAHPSRTTGHPSLARRGAVRRHGGERRATSAGRVRARTLGPPTRDRRAF